MLKDDSHQKAEELKGKVFLFSAYGKFLKSIELVDKKMKCVAFDFTREEDLMLMSDTG